MDKAPFRRKQLNPLDVAAIMLVDLFNRTFAYWRGWIPVVGAVTLEIEDKEQPALEPSQIRIKIVPMNWPSGSHIYAGFNKHGRSIHWVPDAGTVVAPHLVLGDGEPIGNVLFRVTNGRLEFFADDESGAFLARHAQLSNNRHVAAHSEYR